MNSKKCFRILIKYVLISSCFLYLPDFYSQSDSLNHYKFISYNENEINTDNGELNNFFDALKELEIGNREQVNIVHIGDSHVQAGFFSGKVRSGFQKNCSFGNGGRGLIFPYKLARTIGPSDFKCSFTGVWEYSRSVKNDKGYVFGLTGYTARTANFDATIKVNLNKYDNCTHHYVKKLKIFHKNVSTSFDVIAKNLCKEEYNIRKEKFYTEFNFTQVQDSIYLGFDKTEDQQNHFEIYGISVETNDPGIVYHDLGVNGADVPAVLDSELFIPHLQILDPKLVVISLGTNDAYPDSFNKQKFRKQYSDLLDRIEEVLPNISILVTTPGDANRQKRIYNPNNQVAGRVISEIAKLKNIAIWDFYKIMGGAHSFELWKNENLAKSDGLHLSVKGYEVQGELLYAALIKAYRNYMK
jgi:lysophospholipase L1-like esterase